MKEQHQRLGRVEKQFGLPNSTAPGEYVSKAFGGASNVIHSGPFERSTSSGVAGGRTWRRFLFAMLRKAGQETKGGDGRGVVVVQVPARPFLRPAFNKFRQGADRRFLERVAKEVGLGGAL